MKENKMKIKKLRKLGSLALSLILVVSMSFGILNLPKGVFATDTEWPMENGAGVSMTIKNSDGSDWVTSDGWDRLERKTVTVDVEFPQNTDKEKTVSLTVPEGLSYKRINIGADTPMPSGGIDRSIIARLPQNDLLGELMTEVSMPTIDAFGSTYGTVIYKFSKETTKAELSFEVGVDIYRYHGPHIIGKLTTPGVETSRVATPIIAKAYDGADQMGADLNQEVKATGDLSYMDNIGGVYDGSFGYRAENYTTEVKPGSVATLGSYVTSLRSLSEGTQLYSKSREYKISLPEHTTPYEADDYTFWGTTSSHYDTGSGKWIYETVNNWQGFSDNAPFKVKVDENAPEGTFVAPADVSTDSVTYTWYDGSQTTKYVRNLYESVKEIHKVKTLKVVSEIAHKLDVVGATSAEKSRSEEAFIAQPRFIIANNTSETLTKQVMEFVANDDLQVMQICFGLNVASDIWYQTNKTGGEWEHFTVQAGSKKAYLSAYDAGLASDEYFTKVKAKVENIKPGYMNTYYLQGSNIYAFTRLNPTGTGTGELTLYTYESPENPEGTVHWYDYNPLEGTDATSERSNTAVLYASTPLELVYQRASIKYYKNATDRVNGTNSINAITAGETVFVRGTADLERSGRSNKMVNMLNEPNIYVRIPKGMKLAEGTSIKLANSNNLSGIGKDINLSPDAITATETAEGTIYKISTKGTGAYIGGYKKIEVNGKYTSECNAIIVDYAVAIDVSTTGSMDARDIFTFTDNKDDSNMKYNRYHDEFVNVKDKYDLNGNTNVDELLPTPPANILSISPNQGLIMQSYLQPTRGDKTPPYIDGNENTYAYFMPEMSADYTIDIKNNSKDPASKLETYIPIPKVGNDFDSNFQEGNINWNMKLNSAPSVSKLEAGSPVTGTVDNFEILYSKDATNANYTTADANWYKESDLAANNIELKDVAMVKVITPGAKEIEGEGEYRIKIPVDIAETLASAQTDNKIGTMNIFNARFYLDSKTAAGWKKAAKVGAKLVMGEISGKVFNDKNGNSMYDDSDDVIGNHSVALYELKTSGDPTNASDYEPVKVNNVAVTTKTKDDGTYTFNTDNVPTIGAGPYAVKIDKPDTTGWIYTPQDNVLNNDTDDSDFASDGFALGINATLPAAQHVNCGFIEYDSDDLSLALPDPDKGFPNIKVGESHTATNSEVTITPSFFDLVADSTAAYTWTIDDSDGDDYITLDPSTTSKRYVKIKGIKSTFGRSEGTEFKDTVTVRLTIKDKDGATRTDTTEIRVLTSEQPKVTAPGVTAYVGDTAPSITTPYSKWLNMDTPSTNDDVSAEDGDGVHINLTTTGNSANTIIDIGGTNGVASAIDTSTNKYKTPGTYKVSYKVTDQYGNTVSDPGATAYRIVKVNGFPTMTVNTISNDKMVESDGTYTYTDWEDNANDILSTVDALVTAKYKQASDTVGATTTDTPITKSVVITDDATGNKVDSISGAGNYTIKYTATIDNHSVTKDVKVVVLKDIAFDTAHYDTLKIKGGSKTGNIGQATEYGIIKASETGLPTKWQDDPTFTGLDKNTNYKIYARIKGTTNTEQLLTAKTLDLSVEEPSGATLMKTYNGLSQQAPAIVDIYEVDYKGDGDSDDVKTKITSNMTIKYKGASDYTESSPQSYKDAKTYTIEYKVAGTGNNIIEGTYDFTILPYEVKGGDIAWSGLSKEYNGDEQRPSATFTGIGDDSNQTFDLTVNGGTYYKEGGYDVTATMPTGPISTPLSNYKLKLDDNFSNTFNIEKKAISADWKLYNSDDEVQEDFEKVYDGKEYTMKAVIDQSSLAKASDFDSFANEAFNYNQEIKSAYANDYTAKITGINVKDNPSTEDTDIVGSYYVKDTADVTNAKEWKIKKLKANVSWKLYKASDLQNPIDDGSKGFNVPEDGSEYVMKATVTNFIGDDESYLKDYVYSETPKSNKAGEYTVKVTGATAKDADVSASVSAKAAGDEQKALDSYDISSEAKWTISKVEENTVDEGKGNISIDTDVITSKDGGNGDGSVSQGSESGDSNNNGEKVETGDNSDVIPFTLLSLLALGGILVIVRRKKQD